MMDQPIGIAVFGVGRWGVHLVRNFLNHPQARVVAVVDPHSERLNALSQRFVIPVDVTLTTDWHAAFQLPEVEAVAIATPASTHFSLIQTAFAQGHHVLSEKPLTLNVEECLTLCQLAEQHQRQLVIDHTYLFHPCVQQGKQTLRSGLVGNLRYGYATRTHLGPVRQDVDALWDLAIHDIAIFNDWLGESPVQVQAQGTTWLQPQAPNTQLFPAGLSDLVWVKLLYPSGFQAFIHLCWCNPDKQRRLCVVGDQGSLIFDELRTDAPLVFQHGQFDSSNQPFIPVNQAVQVLPIAPGEPLRQVCDHFITCVREDKPSTISSGVTGTQLVRILCALTESLNQGGTVVAIAN